MDRGGCVSVGGVFGGGGEKHFRVVNFKRSVCGWIMRLSLSLPNSCEQFIKYLMLMFYDFIWNDTKDKNQTKNTV